ncbi:MAG: TraB/GumN family protein [Deltaproteobacteria bacterium]|nr:TraB/GumN family protein [Deltaproteobacteria bacterium]MBW2045102.1 TraB/GumN family protein [Deltaproteobacteria bacterium]
MDEQNILRLKGEGKEIILIGTAHVSQESVELVTRVINAERPDTVSVELCQARYESLVQKKKWQDTDLIKIIREKKAFLLLSNLMFASFQRRIGRKLGIRPGQEILAAVEAAHSVGASIYLADRDIRITLSRTWRLMSFWSKIKLLGQLISTIWEVGDIREEDIEELKKKDVLEALISEIGKSLPELRKILIDERDQYMACKIQSAPGQKIIAVVGAGHVPGIQKYWNEPVDLLPLEQVPPKGRFSSVLKWAIPVLIIGIVVLGFFMSGKVKVAHMVKWWVVANASLSGAGAALALGHPLTILAAILASPLTSLNPMIAAGWVAGLVEVLVAKPKVKDFETLADDISSVRGFWRNKITRILMVVVFTNLGSSVGTFVAIPLMLKVLT